MITWCAATRWSISLLASATSASGALIAILPVLRPKPRADHVITTNPLRASSRASSATLLLSPPNPCASRTAGAGICAGR